MIGLDNEIPLGYDDYETMSQLPIAIEHDHDTDGLSLLLAEHGVIKEDVALNEAAGRKPSGSSTPDGSRRSATCAIRNDKRPGRLRRTIGNLAMGLTTALLASWFAWCGVAAWNEEPTASSLEPSVSYQTVDIEKLKKGDQVIAMNPETGEQGLKRVLQTFVRIADHLQILTLEFADGEQQVIETTDEHPFWCASQFKWKNAVELEIGDRVTGPNGEVQFVVDNYREEHPNGIKVYNFEVEDFHTYFVLANGSRAPPVLVHNAHKYDKPLTRPYKRNAFRESVQANATRARNGKAIDPNTGKTIHKKPQYGHTRGREHRRLVKEAEAMGMDQKQFNDWVNDHPEWFQLEDAASNMSHQFELPGS